MQNQYTLTPHQDGNRTIHALYQRECCNYRFLGFIVPYGDGWRGSLYDSRQEHDTPESAADSWVAAAIEEARP